ncbi:hypothetical protein LTR78_009205 [Recurvomyces mirabilis]|uniref:Uncharacterized protein n=1 Tax=Recurvomyces mirabilis TaxID=574656 RepID=A0AAE0WHH2_9PEZI|nr:hypothetical protein LTR78_009205 [Recurvomyces mirabilis]KAK5155635.1 hypothetical protein LTS14_005896 [Recurvomyces mirabilis]
MTKRSFDDLAVVATGAQDLASRFGKRRRHDYDDLPPISPWRCNLTALSQECNLYFVAYGTELYVYDPQFPTQAVSPKPVLIVPSQPSEPGLAGHLDPREPHTINNLIVQRLGNDEVLATVRDDGDVDAILLRHVLQAIVRRAEPGNVFELVASEIRPIFQSNVGISAWGLAIHSQARILACSSNAHEVRVFKFGLLQEDEEMPPTSDSDRMAASTADEHVPAHSHRKMDVTQRVLNGDTNIPYIAFCNTGDDPEARWLLTTDISGYCRVMDLHRRSNTSATVQKFRFGTWSMSSSAGFDRLNAGWAIMFLDPRSFQSVRTFEAAVRLAQGGELPGAKANNRSWDLSDTVEHVPNNSPAFTYNDPKVRRQAQAHRSSISQSASPSNAGSRSGNMSGTSSPGAQGNIIDALVDQLVAQTAQELEDNDMLEDSHEQSDNEAEYDEYSDENIALVDDDEDPDDEGTEDSVSYNSMYGGRRIFGNQPYFYHQGGLCEDLPCPILHASVKNIYLLQPSRQNTTPGAFSPPMVGIANPLRQAVQNRFGYLNILDRLNMNASIPSLGVVVLASQKGRAVVLALTKLSAKAAYPASMKDGIAKAKTNYAMRIECILPFAHQELQNQRPFQPLHGIAVGPVQGTDNMSDERKRWRLMMMYQDHSILSYEISRRRARDSGVEVDTLVV